MLKSLLLASSLVLLSACGTAESPTDLSTAKDLGHSGCGYGSEERNDGKLDLIEQDIVTRVNAFRNQNGLPALLQHGCISMVAYFHSLNMAKQNNASHVLDGLDVTARLNNQGIATSWRGENIHNQWATWGGQPVWDWAGYGASAFNWWMNSPGHRANMLNPNYTHIGVGVSHIAYGDKGYFFATQVFLRE